MAIRIQNFPNRNSMSQFTVSYPSWWNSNEQQITNSLSKNISLKVESPPQLYQDAKRLGLQLPDQESSSTQSIIQSRHEVGAVRGNNSQDQSISSESGQDESCGKGAGGQKKPVFLLTNPDIVLNPSQVDHSLSMACVPYPHADPYYGGMCTPYGPQAIILPQMVGIAPARVPLPLDLSEDGPIYVNAKQYHGILRRRQSRAKLEAKNKLVKTRKPYLHESRHLHALNRIRGSGGRFLSTKKLRQPNPTSSTSIHSVSDTFHLHKKNAISEFESHHSGTGEYVASNTTCSDITTASDNDVIFQQPDHRFSGISLHMGRGMQNNGGLGTRHCASAVR